MISRLRNLASSALDALYPGSCELCDCELSGNATLCKPCAAELPRIRAPFCDICGEPYDGKIDGPFSCPNCAGIRFAFEFTRPVLRRDPQSLDLVHRLKYGRRIDLVHSLGELLEEAFRDSRLETALENRWPLVPVPLHRSRLRQRHFNQAEELARIVSGLTGLPLLNVLRRIRKSQTQTALGRTARQNNLRNAFRARRSSQRNIPLPTEGVILVDDVFTTGSTLNECAKTLRKAGYRRVVAITLMRG